MKMLVVLLSAVLLCGCVVEAPPGSTVVAIQEDSAAAKNMKTIMIAIHESYMVDETWPENLTDLNLGFAVDQFKYVKPTEPLADLDVKLGVLYQVDGDLVGRVDGSIDNK